MELVEGMENKLVEEFDLRDETEMTFDEVSKKWDRLVWKGVNDVMKTKQTSFSPQELYNYGLFGLWKTYRNYGPEKDTSFKTFAYINITGHIKNEIRDEKVSYYGLSRSKVKRKEQVADLLRQMQENKWTWEETREKSGLTKEEWIESVDWNRKRVSINTKISIDGKKETELVELIPADLGIEEKTYQKETVEEIMSSLDEDEKNIIHIRFFEGYNKCEAADLFQMKRSTYNRKEERLLSKIKNIYQNGSLHM